MNIEKFKDTFVSNFLSTWCANHYEDYCRRGLHENLYNPPIEDAYDLAEEITKKVIQFRENG